jgi:2-polyprenyl-3-methyl-5-hydroxy-6-metoxy-1,4-benzoquinol methylase
MIDGGTDAPATGILIGCPARRTGGGAIGDTATPRLGATANRLTGEPAAAAEHHHDRSTMTTPLEANRANWNDRASAHAARTGLGYGVQRYVDDRALLSGVVAFDRERLGDIAGLRAVHLQCHIGTDTLSLARLGARVTGLDFSRVAIEEARRLVAETGDDAQADFVESDVDHALEVLEPEAFDLVYTGIGALCWLPSIRSWARVVAGLLKPGGRLFIREGHPILWSMDDRLTDDLHLRFPYFEQPEPLEWDDESSYVATDRSRPPGRTSGTTAWARS